MKNFSKKGLVALTTMGAVGVSYADSAAMVTKVDNAINADSDALWAVGGSVIILSVIGLIIRKIRAQAS